MRRRSVLFWASSFLCLALASGLESHGTETAEVDLESTPIRIVSKYLNERTTPRPMSSHNMPRSHRVGIRAVTTAPTLSGAAVQMAAGVFPEQRPSGLNNGADDRGAVLAPYERTKKPDEDPADDSIHDSVDPKKTMNRKSSLLFGKEYLKDGDGSCRRPGAKYYEGVSRPYLQVASMDRFTKRLFGLLNMSTKAARYLNEIEFKLNQGFSVDHNDGQAILLAHSRCFTTTSMLLRAILGFKGRLRTDDQEWQRLDIRNAGDPKFGKGLWLFVVRITDTYATLSEDFLSHVFLVTSFGGSLPIVWQSNYYQMTLDDFLHGLPRGRCSLTEFFDDLQKKLVDESNVTKKRKAYNELFGTDISTYAQELGGLPTSIQRKVEAQWEQTHGILMFKKTGPNFKIEIDYRDYDVESAITNIDTRALDVAIFSAPDNPKNNNDRQEQDEHSSHIIS